MKIENKEIWIILISAIVLVAAFGYRAFSASPNAISGIMIFRDIPLSKENYQYLGNEQFSTSIYLPKDNCDGFVNYCSYVYGSNALSQADVNDDGKIDETDIAIVVKAYGCRNGDACWGKPIEECFFTISGRKFKDPTRDCKIDSTDAKLITDNYGKTDDYALDVNCDNYDVCKADINQDGKVDIYDLTIANSKNGQTADLFQRIAYGGSEADVNLDGTVSISDVVIVSGNFGRDAIERKCSRENIDHMSGREYSINVQGTGISWLQASYLCPI